VTRGVRIETPKARFEQDASGTDCRIEALRSERLISAVGPPATGVEPDASCCLIVIVHYPCGRAARASAATSRYSREQLPAARCEANCEANHGRPPGGKARPDGLFAGTG
jgi:phage terminase large subunit-like protein